MTCHDHRLLLCPSPQASLPAERLGDDLHGVVDQRYSRLNSKLNGVPMVRLCTNARGKDAHSSTVAQQFGMHLAEMGHPLRLRRADLFNAHADCCNGDVRLDAKALRDFDTKLL